MRPKTIIEKVWERHVVNQEEGKPDLIYIDLHLIHEVTSPQAFEGLKEKNRKVRRPDLSFATMDHNIPTKDRQYIADPISKRQIEVLVDNCTTFGIRLADLNDEDQGIVHVIGPDLGLTQPGKTIVCGDSHTSTHGAFGALAFGIGTSEVEHVLATQTLWQVRPKTLQVKIDGQLGFGVTAKDVILYVIGKHGIDMGNGHVIEFTGEVIGNMSMEERMTVCNMSIEAGAKAGMVSPDETTFNYLKGRKHSPKGKAFDIAVKEWKTLCTDPDATYDKTIVIQAEKIEPQVTWGTNPSMCISINECLPSPKDQLKLSSVNAVEQALHYMGLEADTPIKDIQIDYVFIGSCTNSRLSDLRAAASVLKGHKVHKNVTALVVPGSQKVKEEAENEGIDKIFKDAGFEWRESGCSMCLAMNPDVVPAGKRCASTSNRNFEGRQGNGSRTHLVSPTMAAAAAVSGHFVDIRTFSTQKV